MFTKKTALSTGIALASLIYLPTATAAPTYLGSLLNKDAGVAANTALVVDGAQAAVAAPNTNTFKGDFQALIQPTSFTSETASGLNLGSTSYTSNVFDYTVSFTIAADYEATLLSFAASLNQNLGALKKGQAEFQLTSETLSGGTLGTTTYANGTAGSASSFSNLNQSFAGVALGAGTYTLEVTGTELVVANSLTHALISAANASAQGISFKASPKQTLDISLTIADRYVGHTPVTPVPEPEQWGMLLLGLPMISWMVRRKQAI
jgi:hypothetical protein